MEAQDGELDGLWTTISIFITLFLLSVCYSATVTLFKVGAALPPHPWAPHCPLAPHSPDAPTVPPGPLLTPHLPTSCAVRRFRCRRAAWYGRVAWAVLTLPPAAGEMDLLLGGGAEADSRP